MADEKQSASVNTPKPAQAQQHSDSDTLVYVELLGKSWLQPTKDGSYKRWHQGDKGEIPESLYDRLGDGNHFKPSFRKVEKEA